MSWSQIIFGCILLVGLIGLSIGYGWKQVRALLHSGDSTLPTEEQLFERRKTLRRLVSCVLIFVMAILLAVQLGLLEPGAERLAEERKGFDADNAPEFTPAEKSFLRLWGGTWIVLLLILLTVVLMAAYDLWVTRRYGLKEYRKLQAERRSMIERQAKRIRRDRNGTG